jgi:hypothetical protein
MEQLEGVDRDLPRALEVRPAAEVLERIVPVRRDDRAAGASRSS